MSAFIAVEKFFTRRPLCFLKNKEANLRSTAFFFQTERIQALSRESIFIMNTRMLSSPLCTQDEQEAVCIKCVPLYFWNVKDFHVPYIWLVQLLWMTRANVVPARNLLSALSLYVWPNLCPCPQNAVQKTFMTRWSLDTFILLAQFTERPARTGPSSHSCLS